MRHYGLSYEANENWRIDAVFHYGDSGDATKGNLLDPTPAIDFDADGFPDGPWDATNNPLGAIPGSEVAYDMTTSMIQFGVSYTFSKKESDD